MATYNDAPLDSDGPSASDNGPSATQQLVNAVRRAAQGIGRLMPLFFFANVVGALLIVYLFIRSNPWDLLATTRMLDLLMRAGVVARTDADVGFIMGLPDHELYMMATAPVDWPIVFFAIALFMAHWMIKAVQFHGIAKFCGIGGSAGQHVRAFLYGNGIGHLLPFNTGAVATAAALEGQGATRDQAALAIYVARIFLIFEVTVYALYSLYLMGWTTWLIQIFWAFVILGVAWLIVRSGQGLPRFSGFTAQLRALGHIGGMLARQPYLLLSLAAQSLVAFLLIDIVVYLVSQAYTDDLWVLLNVEPSLLLMGIVAAYIARMVQITPGGIGQTELAFAMTLDLGGAGFAAGAAIALLWGQTRYISVLLLFGLILFRFGIETSIGRVLALYRGVEPEPPAAPQTAPQPAPQPA